MAKPFCTGYDPDDIIIKLGKYDISGIHSLCYSYDKLQHKRIQPKIKHKNRYWYNKAEAKIQLQI